MAFTFRSPMHRSVAAATIVSTGLLLFIACQPDKSLQPRANRAPIAASGGPYQGEEGALFNFDARSSRDPDGDTLTYAWDFGDGDRGTGGVAGHVYRNNGSYQALLIVADSRGASDTVGTQVSVANAAPVITMLTTPSTPLAIGTAATIQVLYSDPGVLDSLTAQVDWGDETSFPITNGSATHTYATAGSHFVTITVRDNDGAVATRTAPGAIVIRDPSVNHSPVAEIQGPSTSREGGSVRFSARGSTDPEDGDSVRFTWLPGDGRKFNLHEPLGWNIEQGWSYPDDGTYTVSVIVTDRLGAADTASTALTVFNTPPVISAVWPPPQQAVGVPASTRVLYADSGAVDTLTITITWGDGTSDSVVPGRDNNIDSLIHTYATPGSYRIHATIRDNDGGATSATASNALLVFDATKHLIIAGYDVFDLGTLGGNHARPLDVNDYGQIVGSSLTASGSTQAFLWDNGVLRDLGTLGHEHSEAQRINNAGLIAGGVRTGTSHETSSAIAATWQNGIGAVWDSVRAEFGVTPAAINESGDIAWNAHGHEDPEAWVGRGNRWQRLGAILHPLANAYGAAINERGQIAGRSEAVSTGDSPWPRWHAFVWEEGVMRDLGLLGFTPCREEPDRNCGHASATSINENGQIVGFSTAADGSTHAVLWENATVRDLWTTPPEFGYFGESAVINDRGQVAGSSRGQGFFWSGGTLYPLGSLGGGSTVVVDMNEAGTVVGTSMTVSGEQHAFVWTRAQGMGDLNTGPHGFSAAWVVGISFYGDIVGFTAPCILGYYRTCERPAQGRAIIWRKQTP